MRYSYYTSYYERTDFYIHNVKCPATCGFNAHQGAKMFRFAVEYLDGRNPIVVIATDYILEDMFVLFYDEVNASVLTLRTANIEKISRLERSTVDMTDASVNYINNTYLN